MPAGRVRFGAGLVAALVMTIISGGLPAGAVGREAAAGTSSAAAVAEAPGACPSLLAESGIVEGMVGTGWTVTTGDIPKPFRVKILGTLQDGIGPGRDLIIIKVSDLPGKHVISQGGGIWSGMSGSPVYLGNKLAGAVSYGFSNGPSRIGGMTPAGQMQRITTYSAATGTEHRSVRLSSSMRTKVARAAGVHSASVSTLHRLAVPVMVTAAPGTLRNRLTTNLRHELGSIKVLSGAATSAAAASTLGRPARRGWQPRGRHLQWRHHHRRRWHDHIGLRRHGAGFRAPIHGRWQGHVRCRPCQLHHHRR